MAQSRRVEKVSSLIRKEISEILLVGIRDHRIDSKIITITSAEVSGDLQHCKVFVSIFGDENKTKELFSILEESQNYFKGELGRRLKMRRAPEIVFKLDKSMDHSSNILDILGKLEEERKTKKINSLEAQDIN